MALLLNVPYAEKEKAKANGARWNAELKRWYCDNPKSYVKLRRWFEFSDTDLIVLNRLYLIIANQICFKCKKPTTVVSLATDSYLTLDEDEVVELQTNGDIRFIANCDNLSQQLKGLLNYNFKFYKGFSKTTGTYYYGNHCKNCGVLQGNWHLYGEPDSPFFIESVHDAKQLTIFTIKLNYDMELTGELIYSSGDELVDKYATFNNQNLEI